MTSTIGVSFIQVSPLVQNGTATSARPPLGIEGLHGFRCDLTLTDGRKVSVGLTTNRPLALLERAPYLTHLFHGFGVDTFSFYDALRRAAHDPREAVACVNLIGGESVFPHGVELTPALLVGIFTAVIAKIAPYVETEGGYTFVGNSMGGMFAVGTAILMAKEHQKNANCVLDNSMSPDVLGKVSGPFWGEPKTWLHRLLCITARHTGFPGLLAGLNLLFRIPAIRRWYYRTLYNQPTKGQVAYMEQLFKNHARPNGAQDLFRVLANIVSHVGKWKEWLGPRPALPARGLVVSSVGDPVMGVDVATRLGNRFVDAGGNPLPVALTAPGPHLPDGDRFAWTSHATRRALLPSATTPSISIPSQE